jgi:hypothetical protein
VIDVDEEQRKRFKAAVDRKSAEAEAASRATPETPPAAGGQIQGDQANLRSPAESQDSFSEREKGSRHRKVTADKWNQ